MRLLGVIIIAIASVLLVQGAVQAHAPDRDRAKHASHRTGRTPDLASAISTPTVDCGGLMMAASWTTIVYAPSRIGTHSPSADASDDADSSDDCCGVACHVGLGGDGWVRLAWRRLPTSPTLKGTSDLLGIRPGRLERPPRRLEPHRPTPSESAGP